MKFRILLFCILFIGFNIFDCNLIAFCARNNTGISESEAEQSDSTLFVSGNGVAKSKADTANINVNVATKDEKADVATSVNASATDKLINAIKNAGIPDKDIETSGFSVTPVYKFIEETSESTIEGYSVSNSIEITIRKVSDVGDILDLIVSKSEKNEKTTISINNINFSLEDNTASLTESLEKAVADARRKALIVANAANKTIIGIKNISVSSGASFKESIFTGGLSPSVGEGDFSATTPISPRDISVSSSVSIDYLLDK